ncbi:Lysine histidine transporter-like 5 [Forsythia ovata]|uniref:Lysine histidine transporter-like 5 n=1 Tax=Forsythia ovata TaxID=205694 RepID=A0ABD1VNV2_9LAMI
MNDRLPTHNQDLENWLPITASRKAKWWYSAFHNVTATVGAGVLGYSVLATFACVVRGSQHHEPVSHGVRSHTTAGIVFDVFNSMGTIAFAFAGHSVALEIQATIPSTPEKTSKKPMWQGVIVAYIIVAICYFSVGISGFWAFGDRVDDDVLVTLQKPRWVICTANFMVFLHVLGSYQIPSIMWLIIRGPSRWGFHWIASWVSILVGVLITLVGPIGGARYIILSAKDYKMFS